MKINYTDFLSKEIRPAQEEKSQNYEHHIQKLLDNLLVYKAKEMKAKLALTGSYKPY